MLKSIATTRSECTAKHENNVSYNTDYIVPNLIDFWKEMIEKKSKRRLKKEIIIIVKKIVLTKNWLLLVIFKNFLRTIISKHINNVLAIYISY